MTRALAFVAVAGSVGAVCFLTLGYALSGPGWAGTARMLTIGQSGCGDPTSRKEERRLPFAASERVSIRLPASIHYQPGERAEAIVSGDPVLLDHVRIDNGEISLDCDPGWSELPLDINLSGPPVTTWDLYGSGDLTLSQIAQPKLQVNIKGSGNSSAEGQVDLVDLSIFGSGGAAFEKLAAKSVQVDLRGSGGAGMTAQDDADIAITGSGNVELFGNPVVRRSEIKGSGRIRHMP